MRWVGRIAFAACLLSIICASVVWPADASDFDEQQWRALAASDPGQAVEILRLRLQGPLTDDDRVRIHWLLGGVLAEALSDTTGAIDEFRKALLIDPASEYAPDIRYALALSLLSAGRKSEARQELIFVLQQRPDHPLAFSIRATLEELRKVTEKPAAVRVTLPWRPILSSTGRPVSKEHNPVTSPVQPLIRVLLGRATGFWVTSDGPLFLYDGPGQPLGARNGELHCHCDSGWVVCGAVRTSILQIIPAKGRLLHLDGSPYRGALVLRPEGDRLLAVNRLDLESYLYGVLPREMPHEWPLEALKAQAVAARTYALTQAERSAGLPYDVESTVLSQVYGGMNAEQPMARRAVDETRGEVMLFAGKPIVAYFHSHSGGRTEDPVHVWGARLPYLASRPDPHSLAAGNLRWSVRFSWTDIEALASEHIYGIAPLHDLRVVRRHGERAERVALVGRRRSVTLSANQLRLLLGPSKLKSTAFRLVRDAQGVTFLGTGYGHGVGMSQWGARAMALAGANYRQILSFYYQNVTIEKVSTRAD